MALAYNLDGIAARELEPSLSELQALDDMHA
jgi:hypothetical protein